MIDPDRLAELDTFRLDEDTPDEVRISLPARDVRDLVSLISVVRAAIDLRELIAVSLWVTNPEVARAIVRFDEERAT
jgi:hypothetical protein